jgi:hypothetical protein
VKDQITVIASGLPSFALFWPFSIVLRKRDCLPLRSITGHRCPRKEATRKSAMEMAVRGNLGKPTDGFPRFPPPLEIATRFPHSHRADPCSLLPNCKLRNLLAPAARAIFSNKRIGKERFPRRHHSGSFSGLDPGARKVRCSQAERFMISSRYS